MVEDAFEYKQNHFYNIYSRLTMKAKRELGGLGKNNDTRKETIQRLTPSVGRNDRKIQLKSEITYSTEL
jgi:hypothetical protein